MIEQLNESFNNLVEKLEGWLNDFVVALPNIIIAAIVMAIGYMLTGYVQKWARKPVNRLTRHESLRNLLTSIITAVFVIGVIFLVLTVLDLSKAITSLLAGAGVAGLAIGLALQDPIMNLFSGAMMAVRESFKVGDLVESNDFFGTINRISLRSTTITTPQGEHVVIPNKEIYKNPIKNYSVSGQRRVDISCGVSYGDDLNKVKEVAIGTIQDKVEYDTSKDVELYYDEFGGSSINFKLRFWLRDPSLKDYLLARSQAIIALQEAFDQNDIMIPFPIRTLDFGIKGGEKLSAMLKQEMELSMNDNGSKN